MAVNRRAFKKLLAPLYNYIDNSGKLGTKEVVAGLSVSEDGFGPYRKTTFTFTGMAIAMADNAGVIAYGSKKLYTFPAGNIKILGGTLNAVTGKSSAGILATFRATFGVGTAAADNSNTLSGAEQSIVPTTNMGAAVAGVGAAKAINTADIAPQDGTAAAIALFLNALINDADHDVATTPANLTLTGTLEIHWINLGDK